MKGTTNEINHLMGIVYQRNTILNLNYANTNSSSNPFASFKSTVSNPSVNQILAMTPQLN